MTWARVLGYAAGVLGAACLWLLLGATPAAADASDPAPGGLLDRAGVTSDLDGVVGEADRVTDAVTEVTRAGTDGVRRTVSGAPADATVQRVAGSVDEVVAEVEQVADETVRSAAQVVSAASDGAGQVDDVVPAPDQSAVEVDTRDVLVADHPRGAAEPDPAHQRPLARVADREGGVASTPAPAAKSAPIAPTAPSADPSPEQAPDAAVATDLSPGDPADDHGTSESGGGGAAAGEPAEVAVLPATGPADNASTRTERAHPAPAVPPGFSPD